MTNAYLKIDDVTIEDAAKLLEIYGPYIKATQDGETVGYAYANTFKGRSAYDWSVETTIYVKKDCKRNGIGRTLYSQLEVRF